MALTPIQRSNDLRDSENVTTSAGTMIYEADDFVCDDLLAQN